MYTHETQIRVRYADTDKMGFAYYGNYPKFYEIARVEGFRAIGFSYKEMEDTGSRHAGAHHEHQISHGPAKYDDHTDRKGHHPGNASCKNEISL